MRAGRMSRAGTIAVAITGVLSIGVPSVSASSGVAASPAGTSRATSTALLSSAAARGSRRMDVIVELAGQPVSAVDAVTGDAMSSVRSAQLRTALRAQQAAATTNIVAIGGTVDASYQLVYNGLEVSIAGNQVAALTHMKGVKAVYPVTKIERDNTRGVPFVGAPQAWAGIGAHVPVHGEGIKLGIIDTGIDYTHADFGGPGTPAAYQTALSTDTAPPDPSMVGPSAPRVKGGTDLVGDAYNGVTTPVPDSNPLDCNSHGTHVAGTAAGSGVLSDGSTYTGPYDSTTIGSHSWLVGPGAAPQADIYSIRVFGCSGSTSNAIVVSALEWAAANGMNVLNLSLGSAYGGPSGPEQDAISNLTKAGTIVVVSAGNSGQNPYLVGSPGTANGALTVAATQVDKYASIALSTGSTVTAIEANDIVPTNLSLLPVFVVSNGAGGIGLGCNASDYPPSVVGALVVTLRGTCARVDRAIYAQQAGAAAVVMVNSVAGYPPSESEITSNPDTMAPFHVTIPFLGAQPADGSTFLSAAAASAVATVTDASVTDPSATFTSGGARSGDSALKPDVAAPGVAVSSAGMGTGTGVLIDSGTSMASPLTAGVAALVREAHSTWHGGAWFWKAAIVNTASAGAVDSYRTRVDGAGLVQAAPAIATDVVALGDHNTATLSYGFAELGKDYHGKHRITVRNFAATPATFTIGTARDSGSPHSVVVQSTVTVPAHTVVRVPVELDVPVATAGTSATFNDVAGLITLTPDSGDNHDVALAVPYYFVPQATSRVKTTLDTAALEATGSAPATTINTVGPVDGVANWYAWGLSNPPSGGVAPEIDVRAVGASETASTIGFAISTYGRWSNPAADEFDVNIDVDHDGTPDYRLLTADQGLLSGSVQNGVLAEAIFTLSTGAGFFVSGFEAPMNSASIVLRVPRSSLCQTASHCLSSNDGRIGYSVQSFASDGTSGGVSGPALFDTASPAISTGMLDAVPVGATVTENVTYDATEAALTPPLGFMIVSHDNKVAKGQEAQLIALP